jgi:hypothetical protein
LWVRCRDVKSVFGPQTNDPCKESHDYASPLAVWPSSLSYHAWEYLETLVALFAGCNALAVETPSRSVRAHHNQPWRLFVESIASTIGNRRKDARPLVDMIFGNEMSEYWGVRRLGKDPSWGCWKQEILVWNFRTLTLSECRRRLAI